MSTSISNFTLIFIGDTKEARTGVARADVGWKVSLDMSRKDDRGGHGTQTSILVSTKRLGFVLFRHELGVATLGVKSGVGSDLDCVRDF